MKVNNFYNWYMVAATGGNAADFKWPDGQPVDSKFWWPNEPNNYKGKENCTAVFMN